MTDIRAQSTTRERGEAKLVSASPQAPVGRSHPPLAQGPESDPHQQAGITVVFLICSLQFTICCAVF